MQLRDHEAKIGRVDAFRLDPRLIKIDESYNIRDMHSERTRAHIDELKLSIRDPEHGGVKKPIEVRMVGADVFVTDGECRLTAVQELIAEGVDIKSVTCIHEAAGTDQVERVLNFGIAGQGERYTPLEMAGWCRRCLRAGATEEQIAVAAGWKSKASVKQHLDMLELPEPVKDHIRKNDISATTARNLARSELTPEQQIALIAANKEENKRLGVGKKTGHKVTARTLKRDKPKPKPIEYPTLVKPKHPALTAPVPQPQPSDDRTEGETVSAQALIQSEGTPVTGPDDVDALAREGTPRSMTDAELDKGIADAGYTTQPDAALIETTRAKVEQQNGWHPDSVPDPLSGVDTSPTRAGVKELISALEPFANIAHDIDFNVRSDDEVTEVPIKHLKQAWVVFARVCGEQG